MTISKYHWTILYTHHGRPIHLEHIQKYNPNAQIISINWIEQKYRQEFDQKQYAWRNCDKQIRLWLKDNIDVIKHNNVAILEWDVLLTKELPNLHIDKFYANLIKTPNIHGSNWSWFAENNKLKTIEPFSVGVVPLCVLYCSNSHLQKWLSAEYDWLYHEDIFCELRLGSIINHIGIQLTELRIGTIQSKPINLDKIKIGGIYHKVKQQVKL